jgi:SEFIR domain
VAEHQVLPCRVFLSYAHESAAHVAAVERFCRFLRSHGVDARMDLFVAERRVDWVLWTIEEIRLAERVLVMVTSEYRERFERDETADTGRGVQLEAGLIREEIYRDRRAGLEKFLPVLLPGNSVDDIPAILQPHTATHYQIYDLTVAGAEQLLRLLTGQPSRSLPDLGEVPTLPVVSLELVVVLRIAVSGGTPTAGGEVLTAALRFLSPSDAQVHRAPDGEANEAAVTMRPDDHRTFGNLIRALRECAGRAGLMVRVGADLELRSAEHVDLVAARLADCHAAHAMQRAHGASVIVVASASFHTHTRESRRYFPASTAYAPFPEDAPDGPTCWIALPDRPGCPKMPKRSNADPPLANSANRDVNIVHQYGGGNTYHRGDTYHIYGPR